MILTTAIVTSAVVSVVMDVADTVIVVEGYSRVKSRFNNREETTMSFTSKLHTVAATTGRAIVRTDLADVGNGIVQVTKGTGRGLQNVGSGVRDGVRKGREDRINARKAKALEYLAKNTTPEERTVIATQVLASETLNDVKVSDADIMADINELATA